MQRSGWRRGKRAFLEGGGSGGAREGEDVFDPRDRRVNEGGDVLTDIEANSKRTERIQQVIGTKGFKK